MTTDILKRFLLLLASWATGLFILLLFQSRGGPLPLSAIVPHLAYQTLLLASFPAGVGVAPLIVPGRIHGWGLLPVAAVSLALAVFVFVMAGWVAPSRLSGEGPRAMTTPVLAQALSNGVHEAERTGEPADWIRANTLIFEHDRRFVQSMLAVLLPILGLLVGLVGGRIPLSGVRIAFFWSVGLFLVVSEYFAFENGFELVAVRTVGVATPAALFGLLVPGTLILGFGAGVVVDALWPRAGTAVVEA